MAILFASTYLAVYMAAKHSVYVEVPVPMEGVEPQEEGEEVSTVFEQQVLPIFEESNADLVAKLRRAALELGAKNPEGITADDIHSVCPIPEGVDPRIMGSAFQKALWVKSGWMQSRRKENHGRPVRIWKRRVAA